MRPLEIVSGQVEELLRMDKLLASSRRYKIPFTLNKAFKDSIGEKIAVDAGGGITKAVISTVNVENSQSQANTTIFTQFSRVKDTPHNFTTAVFDKDGSIRNDVDSIMNCRLIQLKVVMAGKM